MIGVEVDVDVDELMDVTHLELMDDVLLDRILPKADTKRKGENARAVVLGDNPKDARSTLRASLKMAYFTLCLLVMSSTTFTVVASPDLITHAMLRRFIDALDDRSRSNLQTVCHFTGSNTSSSTSGEEA